MGILEEIFEALTDEDFSFVETMEEFIGGPIAETLDEAEIAAGIDVPELTREYYETRNEGNLALLRARTSQELRDLEEQAALAGIQKKQAGIQKEQAGIAGKQAGIQQKQAELQRQEAEQAMGFEIGTLERQGHRILGQSQVSAAARGVRGASQEAIESEILAETGRVIGRRRQAGEAAMESARLQGQAATLQGKSAALQAQSAGLQGDIYGRRQAGYLQKVEATEEIAGIQGGLLTKLGPIEADLAWKAAWRSEHSDVSWFDVVIGGLNIATSIAGMGTGYGWW